MIVKPIKRKSFLKFFKWGEKKGLALSRTFPCWCILEGVANGTSKNVGLGKFWQDLEISEAFLISLEVSFFHGLFLLF